MLTERFIDLHTHSTASDGSDSPSGIIQKAEALGLAAVALCDHDTVSGLEEFESAAVTSSVEAIPGIEISTMLFHKEVHIVGLFIDRNASCIQEPLAMLRRSRLERNEKIIERLFRAGFEITKEDVAAFAGGESIGRPHIARALIEKGYFENMQEVFAKCLKRGRPFYIPREHIQPDAAIRMIHQAGGLAFWAHPLHDRKGDRAFLKKFLKEMMRWDLDGVEGCYSLFTERQEAITQAVAADLGLLLSGGSDYHGKNQPTIALGTGLGNLKVPYSFLEEIKKRKTALS